MSRQNTSALPRGSVVVVGSGNVAPAVAAAFAGSERSVVIAGRSVGRAEAAARQASAWVETSISAGGLTAATFAEAVLVVECVAENLAIKRAVLASIEPWLSSSATVVSNTSSLSLDEIAEALQVPERFAGLHFLHPAHLTRVVEVVATSRTSPATIGLLHEWAAEMRKRTITVRRPTPGFVWNRLQMALLRECLALVEQGIADADDVDAVVSDGLAPRWLVAGPLATADLGGIAVFQEVARQLYPHLSQETEPSPLLNNAAASGGFYAWEVEDLAIVESARADALRSGSEFAQRRPRPPLRDVGER